MPDKDNYHCGEGELPTHKAMRSLVKRIGRRGAWLLVMALLDFIYAYGLIFPTQFARTSPSLSYFQRWMPLTAWGIIWGLVSLTCLIYAFKIKDGIGFGVAVGLKVGWAMTLLLGWIVGDVERGYQSAAFFFALAAALLLTASWRENYQMVEIDLQPPPLVKGERL